MTNIINLFRRADERHKLFAELLREHLLPMYRVAYRWTQNREDAEDLVQDVLAKLVDRTYEMARVEKLRPWLIKVLYRCFVDNYRKQARSPLVGGSGWTADTALLDELINRIPEDKSAIERYEQQRMILQALESLNEDQRDVVLLHDTEGYSAEEVAAILDISVGTVKSRLHRARLVLKNILQ